MISQHQKSLRYIVPITLLVLLFLFIILYTNSRTSLLSQGVSLSIENIQDGKIVYSPVLTLKGNAKRAIFLTINNREMYIDKEGDFTDITTLSPGLNILTIRTNDKFKNTEVLEYRVWLEKSSQETTGEMIARFGSVLAVEQSEKIISTEEIIPPE